MKMRRSAHSTKVLALVVASVAACVPTAAHIQRHEVRAEAYASRGMVDAAAGERLRAEREREQLSSSQSIVFARDGH